MNRRYAAFYVFYLLVAVMITWPLATQLSSVLLGHPFSDSTEYVRHIWWFSHALRTGQPLLDQPLLGYPQGLNGAWLGATLLQSFPAALLALMMPLPVAFNVTALLRLALNGWAMACLMQYMVPQRRGAAVIAGLVFMAYPTFQGQLGAGHLGLLAVWPVPLYVLALLKGRQTGRWQWWVLAVLCLTLSSMGSPLLLIFLVGPVSLLLMLRALIQHDGLMLRGLLLTGVAGGVLIGLMVVPALLDTALPDAGDTVTYSADLLGLVTPSYQHPVFGQLAYTHTILGREPFERMAYVGLVAGGLALWAVWRMPALRGWAWLALLVWPLTLGPVLHVLDNTVLLDLGEQVSYVTLPWLALGGLPVLDTLRTPARFNFTLAFVVAVLAGYGVAQLPRWRWHGMGIAVLALLIVFEYQVFWPLPLRDAAIPAAVSALAEREDIRAVLDVPWRHPLAQKDGMYLQTAHQQPLLAGFITRQTPVDPAMLTLLEKTLDPALLDREGADLLIWHKEWAAAGAADPRTTWGDPLYEDGRIAIFDVPAPQTAPVFSVSAAATYTVYDSETAYFFAPEPGWVAVRGVVADGDLQLMLNGESVGRWAGDALALPLLEAGYYTLTLTREIACPAHPIAPLYCAAVTVSDFSISAFTPAPVAEGGRLQAVSAQITLAAYRLRVDGQAIIADLHWSAQLADKAELVRFVQVLDSSGVLVAQSDEPYSGQLLESVRFSGLPPGDYELYTGWYTLPDVTRLAVMNGGPGTEADWLPLGTITLDEDI